MMNAEAYLRRIGYTGSKSPTLETLRALQWQHLRTVPYETLDITDGIPFTLETEAVYDKVVNRRRGGYCFELNGLFAWLLKKLGFDISEHFARFLREETGLPMRRHRVIRVCLPEGEFIADVGVGSACPRFPLKLENGLRQYDGANEYMFTSDKILGHVINELYHGEFRPYYAFTDEKEYPVDFTAIDYYCQNAPDSYFKSGRMVSLKTESGRITISGDEYREFCGEDVKVRKLESPEELAKILEEKFGIKK